MEDLHAELGLGVPRKTRSVHSLALVATLALLHHAECLRVEGEVGTRERHEEIVPGMREDIEKHDAGRGRFGARAEGPPTLGAWTEFGSGGWIHGVGCPPVTTPKEAKKKPLRYGTGGAKVG